MGLFSTILEKLGLKKKEEQQPPVAPVVPKPTTTTTVKPVTSAPAPKPAPTYVPKPPTVTAVSTPVVPKPTPVSEVDVVKKLEKLSSGSGLDWKVSIVDLLKLLEIDSSREARNELAKELGCPDDLMKDSAKMNVWLHKTVLKKIAENGGNIPRELLD